MSELRSSLAFVGTYTNNESEGIYGYRLNSEAGEFEALGTTMVGDNPSFLTIHPSGEFLYAVNETDPGNVAACEVDQRTGELSTLNRRPSGASGPCHCSVDATGQFLLVAHYGGGSISMLPIEDDGHLGNPTELIEHDGTHIDSSDPPTPRPHAAIPGPDNRFVYVPDLGLDEVVVYKLDLERGRLSRASAVQMSAGTGPRHLVFHPNNQVGYVINEPDSSLTILDRDTRTGELNFVESLRTTPSTFDGENHSADVHVHPSGRWAYGSNRGHDSIAVFDIKDENGRLEPMGYVSTGGKYPRNIAIDPTGRFLVAENRHTDDLVLFQITDEGHLKATGEKTLVPDPSCMQFLADSSPE
ncbi:lactonase family protein [Halocatena marina]|uniref:Lactonase family protein n=1 Tax=Halocatena marina TaxID=2934937 RepID=A0ABD5YWF8_9EURY|nr:lactonase family protein [Halocatena marina]